MKRRTGTRRGERGQGMTEYALVVAIIAILSMSILYAFGDQLRNLLWASGTEMSGEDASIENKMGDAPGDKTISDL